MPFNYYNLKEIDTLLNPQHIIVLIFWKYEKTWFVLIFWVGTAMNFC